MHTHAERGHDQQGERSAFSGTGFSREEASRGANNFADRAPILWASLLANAAFQTPNIRRMYQCLREQARSHKSPASLAHNPPLIRS
jgi:hypothetical protein